MTVSGRGYPAGAPLLVELFTDPVLLTSTTADAAGAFQIVITVPPGARPGPAMLRVSVQGGNERAETTLRVAPPPPLGLLDGVTRSILDVLGLGVGGR